MWHVGVDVHLKSCSVCVLDENGLCVPITPTDDVIRTSPKDTWNLTDVKFANSHRILEAPLPRKVAHNYRAHNLVLQ